MTVKKARDAYMESLIDLVKVAEGYDLFPGNANRFADLRKAQGACDNLLWQLELARYNEGLTKGV